MHCPRCGQQQISNQTRFCSRCGFQLGVVAELLLHDGYLPQLAQLEKHSWKKTLFTKKGGVLFSVFWFILFTMFFTSIAGILDLGDLAGVFAVMGVFGSMLILIASLVALPSSKTQARVLTGDLAGPPPPNFPEANQYGELPPVQSQPAGEYFAPRGDWRAPNTGDLATPGSVTDETTKLLKKEKEL